MPRDLIQLISQPLPPAPLLQMFKTFLQRRRHGLGLCFSGQRYDGLRQPFCFRISNIQSHTFTITTQLTIQLHYKSKQIYLQWITSSRHRLQGSLDTGATY